jgi:hypothetical protein
MELPLFIKGDSIGKEKATHKYYGFKNQQSFLEAVRLDRAFKHLQQRGKAWK